MDPITPQPQYQTLVPERKHFLNKKFIVTFVILALLGAGAYASIWWWGNQQQSDIYTFEECTKAKDSKILETYPEQCVTKNGQTFVNFNQKVDPTESWKTYTNAQYGFEFKYPGSWEFKTKDPASFPGFVVSNIQSTLSIFPKGTDTLFGGPPSIVSLFPSQSEAERYLNSTQLEEPVVKEGELNNIKVDIGQLLNIENGKGMLAWYMFKTPLVNWSKYGLIVLYLKDKTELSTINQILSTFKFTDSALSSECSGKTTTNIGGSVYPVATKYSKLGSLGMYFTAEDCSVTRLAEVVKNQYPHYGEHIVLNKLPSSALIVVLKQIGLIPSPEKCANKSENSCVDWRPLKESDFIPANLIQLRPFIDFIKSADCYFCG